MSRSGPVSKVGRFGPILGVSCFGLIKFLCVRDVRVRGWKDWLDVEFCFDKADN